MDNGLIVRKLHHISEDIFYDEGFYGNREARSANYDILKYATRIVEQQDLLEDILSDLLKSVGSYHNAGGDIVFFTKIVSISYSIEKILKASSYARQRVYNSINKAEEED